MTSPTLHRATLVTLSVDRSGTTTADRLALCDSALTYDGDTYAATPTAELETAALTGAASDDAWLLTVPAAGLAARLADGERMAEVSVEIREADPTDLASAPVRWYGWVRRAVKNPNGEPDRVRLECGGIKSRLDGVICGLRATSLCGWVLGARHCHIDLDDWRETGTVTDITGTVVTLTGLTTTTAGHWSRGYAQRGETRITIRDDGAGTITLDRPPPADWAGETLTLTPGCDKTEDTCRTKFDNIARFGGCGARMPLANPLLG